MSTAIMQADERIINFLPFSKGELEYAEILF